MDLYHELKALLGRDIVSIESNDLVQYGQDETEDFVFKPEVVVKPKTVNDVQQLMVFCNQS